MKTKMLKIMASLVIITSCLLACNDQKPQPNGNENNPIKPQEPCLCIMDTLKGEWNWIKTYTAKHGIIDNEFKSILKVFSQNEDSSINYEAIVEDTLFYKGSFQLQYDQWNNNITNIELPHYNLGRNWLILFMDIEGKPSKDTLCFFSGNPDDYMYYYQKIK